MIIISLSILLLVILVLGIILISDYFKNENNEQNTQLEFKEVYSGNYISYKPQTLSQEVKIPWKVEATTSCPK